MSKFILSGFADEIDPMLNVQMDVMKKLDISYIEMRGVNDKNVSTLSVDEAKEIKKQLDANGFKISALGSPIGKIKITDDFAPELEKFKHCLELAKILDTKYIRMFSFFMKAEDAPTYRDEVIARWSQYVEAAKGSGIILLHENEKDIYGDIASRCFDLISTLNCDYVKATFDPANFVQCGEKILPAYELLKPYIEYLHIKDARYADGQVVPAGQGDGAIKELLTQLKQSGFEGFVSLEPHLSNFKGFAELEADGNLADLPEGGAKTFGIAVDALKNILKSL